MRSVNLLKIAANAELLRLRAMLARQARRAVWGVLAIIFVLYVMTLLEIVGWQVLCLYVVPIAATSILIGINLILVSIFGILAVRSSPNHVEREALRVRRQALDSARGGLIISAAVPAITTLIRRRRRSRR